MKRALAIITVALAVTAACSKQTELASNKNAKGTITVAAAPPKTPPPELPPEALAELAADNPDLAPVPAGGTDAPAGAATVTDYRPGISGQLGGLPAVGDAAALAGVFIEWRNRAASSPGGFEPGQIQLGADEQEYRPSDAELVAAEAGDRLSAALNGADEATKAAIAATVGDNHAYRRFDFRRVDVMGSGRYVYASAPKDARLPL